MPLPPDFCWGWRVVVPEGLGASGEALWVETTKARTIGAAHKTVLLNACRIADRLDDLVVEINGRLTTTNHQGTEVINPLISEHRQQFATLSMILSRLGVGELPAAASGDKPWAQVVADEVAKKRAEKSG